MNLAQEGDLALLIGVTWGAIAGYAGGQVDAVMMRIVDILYALPFMIFIVLLMVVFGRNLLLLFLANECNVPDSTLPQHGAHGAGHVEAGGKFLGRDQLQGTPRGRGPGLLPL